jgi:hypothetical protein
MPDDLTPEEELRLLPLAQERMDPAARAAVREAIAAGRFREAITLIRKNLRAVHQEEQAHIN